MHPKSTVPAETQIFSRERVLIPSFAFDPSDPWTATFQSGLERAGLAGRRVYEVGLGSGINAAFMLRRCAVSLIRGSDLDPRLPALAQQLVAAAVPDRIDRFRPIPGSVDLIDTPLAAAEVTMADVVVGCLPQVPDPNDEMYIRFHTDQMTAETIETRWSDDHRSHYYPWQPFHGYPFNTVGLGLVEALLRRVRSRSPSAQVILNLGCRVGKQTVLDLFHMNGYRPEELASRIVAQDGRTDITFFAALEVALRGTGCEQEFVCEFYADPEGRTPLSADEAKSQLEANPGTPVFHEVCVLRGHP